MTYEASILASQADTEFASETTAPDEPSEQSHDDRLEKETAVAAAQAASDSWISERPLDKSKLTDPDRCIGELNRKYAVVNAGNRVAVIEERGTSIRTLSKEAFLDSFLNIKVSVGQRSENLGTYWFKHPDRRQYLDGILFDPDEACSAGTYNLWRGLAVKPDPSKSCELILQHVREILCSEDEECSEYFLNWLALLVQQPGRLPGVAVCLLSEQGTGKGTTLQYIGRLLGQHYKHITDKGQLLGTFSGHLEDAVLVFADELHWEGSKSETSLIKGLITEPTRMIERKYHTPTEVKNCVHLLVASNEQWAIPAELSDRRFFVLDVSSLRRNDHAYFGSLISEMKNGGPEALLAFLQARDISAFNPADFPKTKARVSQQLASLRPVERWLHEIAVTGSTSLLSQTEPTDWPCRLPKSEVHGAYRNWFVNSRLPGVPEGIRSFTSALKAFGFSLTKMPDEDTGRRVPAYKLPSISGLRQAIDAALGHPVDWEPL